MRSVFSSLILCSAFIWLSSCQSRTAPKGRATVRIAIPGTPITYLPIYLARDLGFFAEQGLTVTLDEVQGGPKALQAMFGGSADVAAAFFELAVQMSTDGRQVKSFLTLLDRPGFALVVSPASLRKIRQIEDLRGATVGVSTPGSGSHQFVSYLLAQHGVRLEDVSISGVGLGATAVTAIERGRTDAAVLIGSGLATIERRFPKLLILADTRTPEGVKQIFGTDLYPSHSLLARAEWLRSNRDAAEKTARAVRQATRWMLEHPTEEIRARISSEYRAPDPATDLEALRQTIPMLSRDGKVTPTGAEAVKQVLTVSSDKIRKATIDLSQTYTNEFIH